MCCVHYAGNRLHEKMDEEMGTVKQECQIRIVRCQDCKYYRAHLCVCTRDYAVHNKMYFCSSGVRAEEDVDNRR